MITFSCTNCGKSFSVVDEAAGRKGKCKTCGASVLVPTLSESKTPGRIVISFDHHASGSRAGGIPPPPGATPPARRAADAPAVSTRLSIQAVPPLQARTAETSIAGEAMAETAADNRKPPMRTRRLTADAAQVRQAFTGFPLIQVRSITGNPPDRYQIEYFVRGLVRGTAGTPVCQDHHVAEIQLTSEYPRQSPKCKMLTPIFHPNFDPVVICVGDHWTAGERLVDLIIRIGEMIAYQTYNIKSPLDGEAAMWADRNGQRLPTDTRELRPPQMD